MSLGSLYGIPNWDEDPISNLEYTMTVTCYYCNVAIPNNQAKRCSRCLLVTYCSKSCQTISWKVSHKINCVPNPTVAALNGTKPEKFSSEWIELEVDKLLSKWMAEWRQCFMHWTMLALDLANHPPSRVVTHCLHIIVQPRHFQTKTYKNYSVVDAAVVPLSQIQETHPDLITEIDPTNFNRFRYVVTLQNSDGELLRVRLFQWSVRSLALWNELPKDSSTNLSEGVVQVLMHSVEHTAPDIMELKLGLQ